MSGRGDDRDRELAYYRRLLDEMAAEKMRLDHQHWMLRTQLRQKREAFQLLSTLAASIGPQTSVAELLHLVALEMHARLGMDRVVVLEPAGGPLTCRPTHWAGFHGDTGDGLAQLLFELPADLASRGGLLLVSTGDADTPLVSSLRSGLDLRTFACVPILGDEAPLGFLLAGRNLQGTMFPALDEGDVGTLRAIGGVIEAVVRNARIARLEQTQRLKAELFANLSHELRTPLTLTLGPLERILGGHHGALPEAVADKLSVVQRSQERLLGIINEVLELARLEGGGARLAAVPTPQVNGFVRERVAQFRPAAEARGLSLELDLDPHLDGADLFLDVSRFERLIHNLLANALKFTERGRVRVRTLLQGGRFQLVVSDTGVGMRAQDLPRVFDRFQQAHGEGLGIAAGTGIGLALVKEIATLHGGVVAVESEEGRGTSFTVSIPLGCTHLAEGARAMPVTEARAAVAALVAAPAPRGPGDVESENRAAEASFDETRPVVLYVEDDAELRAHVREVLAPAANVFLAVDGHDGLHKARRYGPDLVITDQMMPGADGRALLHAMRSDEALRDTPVVFLTAVAGTEGRIETLAAGADDYLSKPFSEAELQARVHNLLRARTQQRSLAALSRRLEARVEEQVGELLRAGSLQRFLPAPLVESLLAGTLPEEPVRQRVTVLTADLSDLVAYADRMEPEELAGLFDEHLREVAAVATAHGGTLDGFASDRICLLFGAPLPLPDAEQAWAAVRAARDIRDRVGALARTARRRGIAADLTVRVAVSSGYCTVGAFGGEGMRIYTAVGFARAASLALGAQAQPGTIVLGEPTWALVRDRVHARALPRTTAGVRTLSAYELLDGPAPDEAPRGDEAPRSSRDAGALGANLFRREGEYWMVAWRGRVLHLRDGKGARYLAHLLAHPQIDVFVLDLVGGQDGGPLSERGAGAGAASDSEAPATDLGDAGGALDARAKRAYRDRLEALRGELEEARGFRDAARAARLEEEMASLSGELAAAVGLGGRDRRVGSAAERARVNVTRAVRNVIDRLAQDHPELGRHLAASIRTGMFCAYSPEAGQPSGWEVR